MNLTELRQSCESSSKKYGMYGQVAIPAAYILQMLDLLDEMAGYSQRVMNLLEENGAGIVPHLLDSDENAGSGLRQAIAKYNAWKDGK